MRKYIIIGIVIIVFLALHFGQKYIDQRSGDYDAVSKSAFNEYQQAIKLEYNEPQKAFEHLANAEELYKKAILIKPDADIITYQNLANIQSRQKNWKEAQKTLSKSIKHHPIEETLYTHLVNIIDNEVQYNCNTIYNNQTCKEEKQKAHKKIINIMEKYVQVSPTHKVALKELGLAYAKDGKYNLAMDYYKKALQNNINDSKEFECSIYKCIGDLYKDQALFEVAIEFYNKSRNTLVACPGLAESLKDTVKKMKESKSKEKPQKF
jgi:tetratricopeptide (TPR) repeat protein